MEVVQAFFANILENYFIQQAEFSEMKYNLFITLFFAAQCLVLWAWLLIKSLTRQVPVAPAQVLAKKDESLTELISALIQNQASQQDRYTDEVARLHRHSLETIKSVVAMANDYKEDEA